MASNIYTTSQRPKFTGFTQASGQLSLLAETPQEKLNTFGWKVTTNEELYTSDTLIGNWNEERFDVKNLRRPKPLPSQVSPIGEEIPWNYSGRIVIKSGQPFVGSIGCA